MKFYLDHVDREFNFYQNRFGFEIGECFYTLNRRGEKRDIVWFGKILKTSCWIKVKQPETLLTYPDEVVRYIVKSYLEGEEDWIKVFIKIVNEAEYRYTSQKIAKDVFRVNIILLDDYFSLRLPYP